MPYKQFDNNNLQREKQIEETKKGKPEEKDFKGYQMDLFSDFLANTDAEKDRLSNTIELWDATPKYFMDRKRQTKLRKEGGFLDSITRPFEHKGKAYDVTIYPARIGNKKTDKEIEYFPAGKEYSIELALRKLAARKGNGFANKHRSGLLFTAWELRQELKATGRSMSHAQVVESLDILRGTRIVITPLNDRAGKMDVSILSGLVVVGKKDYLKDPHSKWMVDFSTLVTLSINNVTYRQHDYTIVMSLNDLARYITLRMSHNWKQAAIGSFFHIKYTTLRRDSCLLESKRSHDNLTKIEIAIKQMIKKERITHVTLHKEKRGPRNTLVDVEFHFHPHPKFVAEQKRANKRHGE